MRSMTSMVNMTFLSDFNDNDSGFLVSYQTVPGNEV